MKKRNRIITMVLSMGLLAGTCAFSNASPEKNICSECTVNASPETASAPVITKHPENVELCEFETFTLTVEASGNNLKYQWQYKREDSSTWSNCYGETSPTFSRQVSEYFNGNKYRCTVTSGTTTVISAEAKITIVSPVVITSQPQNITVEENKLFYMSVRAKGDNLKYQWQYLKNGTWVNAEGENEPDIIGFKVSYSEYNGRRYRCIVSSGKRSVTSGEAVLNVIPNLTITRNPYSTAINENGSFELTVKASHKGASYQWQRSYDNKYWYNISGETSDSFKRKNVSYDSNGTLYRCKVTLNTKTVYSDYAYLTVRPFQIISNPKNLRIHENGKAEFKVKAVGENLKYQWQYNYKNKGWIDLSDTSDTLTRDPAGMCYNENHYRCIVKCGNRTLYSTEASLTIVRPAKIIEQPKNVSAEENTYYTVSVTATGSDLDYTWEYYSERNGHWVWMRDVPSTSNYITALAKPELNGSKYRCSISDGVKTIVSDEAVVTVNPPIMILGQPTNNFIAEGNNYSFSVRTNRADTVYQWQYKPRIGRTWINVGSNSPTYYGYNASLEDDLSSFRCLVTAGGKTTSTGIVCIVVDKFEITTQPKSVTGYVNGTYKFSTEATGKNVVYTWQYKLKGSSTWKIFSYVPTAALENVDKSINAKIKLTL